MWSAGVTRNPWLDIPGSDYEGHMSGPEVQQLQALSGLFAEALRSARPQTILLAGSALGNGLDHVDGSVTTRVTCVDINLRYLEQIGEQFKTAEFSLDLVYADLNTHEFAPESFDLIFAGLVLEYVDWRRVLPQFASALCRNGLLAVALQLPSKHTPVVTPSGFSSLAPLEALFNFVDPDALVEAAGGHRLGAVMRRTEALPSHKAFQVINFKRVSELAVRS